MGNIAVLVAVELWHYSGRCHPTLESLRDGDQHLLKITSSWFSALVDLIFAAFWGS